MLLWGVPPRKPKRLSLEDQFGPMIRSGKKPHPRSLDALFPPPPPPKRCPAGHTQTPDWRIAHGCSTCHKQEAEFARRQIERTVERQQAAAREREEERAKLPALPAVYVMPVTLGRDQVFRVPKGLMRRKPGRGRRRS